MGCDRRALLRDKRKISASVARKFKDGSLIH
jgi:hypothetical protein